MRRTFRHLTFANVASALALFVALSGGTALALSGSNAPPTASATGVCDSGRPLTIRVGAPDTPICTVGSLTLLARCIPTGPDETEADLLLDTSTDHAFVASEDEQAGNLKAADPPVELV